MNRTKKILLMIIVLIAVILIGTQVQANFTVCKEDVPKYIQGHHFFPTNAEGGVLFCIQPGGSFKATLTRGKYDEYPVGKYWPENAVCISKLGTPPKLGYYLKYEQGATIDYSDHQDEAYNLANFEEKGGIISWDSQFATWASSVSNPMAPFTQGLEGKAYKKFYELIQAGFDSLVSFGKGDIKIGVNQDEGSYTVGPFTVTYPDGQYGHKNLFSWIEKTEVVTDTGTYPIQILDIGGAEITGLGKEESNTLNGKEFYIKFYSTEATKITNLQFTFGYLHHCEASMTEYKGTKIERYWEKDGPYSCTHERESEYKDENGETHTETVEYDKKDAYRYVVKERDLGSSQVLMLYKPTAKKVYEKAVINKSFGGEIDLTMKIAGFVFLDKATGKDLQLNNTMNDGEALPGVEVAIYETTSPDGNKTSTHKHSGNSSTYGGCYTIPAYHKHSGSPTEYGSCYSKVAATSHSHIGNKNIGGACFKTAVYHTHDENCKTYTDITNADGTVTRIEGQYSCISDGSNYTRGINRHTHTSECPVDANGNYTNACILSNESNMILYYEQTCTQSVTYEATCGKSEQTIEGYKLSCNKTVDLIKGSSSELKWMLTDNEGHYEFTKLNSQKKYYIEFIYNGMLYTNVERLAGNAEDISKSTEEAQGHNGNRQAFNDQFEHIGSFPNNYNINGENRRAYLQEEIVEEFKNIAKNHGKHGNDSKSLYASDCRISAYSTEIYPLINVFTIDTSWNYIAGKNYLPIYGGQYDQLHVNLGITARETFDMALYKDVLKADVVINEKTETYNYDARKAGPNGFALGVRERDYYTGNGALGISESDYLTRIGKAYQEGGNISDPGHTRAVETDTYDIDMRSEEVANGQSTEYKKGNAKVEKDDGSKEDAITGEYDIKDIKDDKDTYKINEDYDTMQKGEKKNEDNRLKIYVTYKLALRNQSSTIGAITEIVDYFDTNFEFVRAYVGDIDGNQTGTVTHDYNSMYKNSMYKSKLYENDPEKLKGYKTIYLRPDAETRLGESDEQYIYVVLQLLGPTNDAGDLLSEKLLNNDTLAVMNLAEINGYKTYYEKDSNNTKGPGLVDIDSNPGNLNISNIASLTQENIVNYQNIRDMYEDDTSRAPAYIYKLLESRTIEGQVFEDEGKVKENGRKGIVVHTGEERLGSGTIDNNDKPIKDVIVELIEIKNGEMKVRATTKTNNRGWYGFTGFIPGEYTVRFTYGFNDDTAMTTTQVFNRKGSNDTSYNGQDYQSTTYRKDATNGLTTNSYDTDKGNKSLTARYQNAKNNGEEKLLGNVQPIQAIDTYGTNNYWYTVDNKLSDARDDAQRVQEVIDYSKQEYGREIVNHKAEVFNAYVNPQASHITADDHEKLVDELERRTYRYAYTPQIEIEVEYAKETVGGNQKKKEYEHKIVGVDFGVVERPKSELVIDQDVENIKVTAADGNTVLFDTKTETNNLQWIKGTFNFKQTDFYKGKKISDYDKNELINIIMDDELISGAKIEITYKLKITNNGEVDANTTTRAKSIINYVANNLEFDENDNMLKGKALWRVVKVEDIQNAKHSTFINNTDRSHYNSNDTTGLKLLDLSTQSTILEATEDNPLTKTALKPGDFVETTLHLKKVLATESSQDDLKYTNMTEIAEIDNTVGRYDHGATPGNQSVELQPQEHDTSGASRNTTFDADLNIDDTTPPDGEIIITPPTGSTHIYYVLGIGVTVILALGLYLINRFVLRRRK